jgi:signal transduction histidine kinase/ligand-binding sensor domain-containing protein
MRIIIFTLLFVLSNIAGFASKAVTKYYSVHSGLSNSDVNCCYQDHLGFIWVGTKDGLNKYDGIEFKTYFYAITDSQSIAGNSVNGIFESKDKKLWILTNLGACFYNREHDNFIRVEADMAGGGEDKLFISSAQETEAGEIYFATKEGLYIFHPESGRLLPQYRDKQYYKNLTDLEIVSPEKFWIASHTNGITLISGQNNIQRIPLLDQQNKKILDYTVFDLEMDQEGSLWTSHNGTLYIFDTVSFAFTPYIQPISGQTISFDGLLRNIMAGTHQRMWLSTDNEGVWVFDKAKNTLIQIISSDQEENVIVKTKKVLEDRDGNFWIPTALGLNFVVYGKSNRVKTLTKNFSAKSTLSSNIISCAYRQQDGTFWIGTDDMGVNRYDPETKTYTHFVHDANNPNSIGANSVLSIYEDNKGNLWLGGYYAGLCLFNRETEDFTVLKNRPGDPSSLSHDDVRDIRQDSEGNLWVLTNGGGLNRLISLEEGTFERFDFDAQNLEGQIIDVFGTKMAEIGNHKLLIGSYRGFSVFDYKKRTFLNYTPQYSDNKGLTHSWIMFFEKDVHNNFWIATGNGLHYFIPETGEVFYYEGLELSGNLINSVIAHKNKLYLTTGKGLDILTVDYTGKKPNVNHIRTITSIDDMGYLMFFQSSGYKDNNDNIYFGSRQGLVYFHPDSLNFDTEPPPVYFTDFLAYYQSVEIGSGSLLKKHISMLDSIEIQPNWSLVTFKFAALNYHNNRQNTYSYKLHPIDKEWRNIGNRHEVTFNGLDPGHYTLTVRGANDSGSFCEEGASIHLTVLPKWHETLAFRLGAVIALMVLIIAIYFYKTNMLRVQKAKLEHRVQQKTKDLSVANQLLEHKHKEILGQNTALIEQKHHIEEMYSKLQGQQEQILKQNEELYYHRNKLEELISARTEELEKALKRAEESDLLKTAFLNNINHEIRTPLNAIVGFANLIVEENQSELNKHLSEILLGNIETLLEIINNIIDISKLETGGIVLINKNTNITALMHKLSDRLKSRLVECNGKQLEIRSVLQTGSGPFHLHIDGDRLYQILWNLADNAIKYTENGYIEIGLQMQNDDKVKFYVKDTGPGIKDNDIIRIFKSFMKIESEKDIFYKGLGIGLTIALHLANLLNGKLEVTSELGKGSVFSFILPVTKS